MPGSCFLECQEPGSAVGFLAVWWAGDAFLLSIHTWLWWEACGQQQVSARCPLHPEICSMRVTSRVFSQVSVSLESLFLVAAINADLRIIGNLT